MDMSNDIEEEMKILAKYRRTVLNKLHKEQKKIDYLKYLVYKMKKHKI